MKFRTDFVTNSSSSSFLITFSSRDELDAALSALAQECADEDDTAVAEAVRMLTEDLAQEPTFSMSNPSDELERLVYNDATYELTCILDCPDRVKFTLMDEIWEALRLKREWLAAHPDDHYGLYGTQSFERLRQSVAEKAMQSLIRYTADRPNAVVVEYGDHSITGCILEHDILPFFPLTVKRFSNH